MDHPSPQSIGRDKSLRLQIDNKLDVNYGNSGTDIICASQRQDVDPLEKRDRSNGDPGSSSTSTVHAPEKKLTLFALQLALLQKMATGIGALGFIWATVVLLGGFAIKLSKIDFWFVTIILLIEGARIFSRSRELEWQHQSTSMPAADGGMYSFKVLKPSRTWTSSEVPLIPYTGCFSLSRNISMLFYWLQLLSASACITLSVVRLVLLSHGDPIASEGDTKNEETAVIIFYGLALAEAFLSLLEKIYWKWTFHHRRLLEEVNKECELGSPGMICIKRFFYDAYSECLNGSIFDGLKLDLVSFGTELLASDSSDEQLIGARILLKFSINTRFSNDTLRKIGTSISVIERLVEMLNWKNPQEAEIRQAAAEIVSTLAGKKHNSLRVSGIPGAMVSISCLLYTQHNSDCASNETWETEIVYDQENYEFSTFNQLGLIILKKLARNHDNCEKIVNTRGLLPKIVSFTYTGERLLRNSHDRDSRILAVKRSLQVLKLLTRTRGTMGKHLREDIVEIVFTISNIREILKYGEKYPKLQQIGIELLINLTFEVEATERIGSTGGIIKELFRIFFQEQITNDQNNLRVAAGEAIAKLALKSEKNCSRILNQDILTKLVGALEDPLLRINSARILRNLCTYAGQDCFVRLKGVSSAAAPTVLKAIMSTENENKLQEVMLGLAAQVCRFITPEEERITFNQTGIGEAELAIKLLEILKIYQNPSSKVPRMRRFAIELAISMMKNNKAMAQTFRALGMLEELEILGESTSEIESFDIFDGTVGLSRHSTTMYTLVENAFDLLAEG